VKPSFGMEVTTSVSGYVILLDINYPLYLLDDLNIINKQMSHDLSMNLMHDVNGSSLKIYV
jgi:hypothetical protein